MVFGSCFFRWEVWGCLKVPFNWNTTWISLGIGSMVLWSVGKFWGEVSASKNQGGYWGSQRGRDNVVNVNGFCKTEHLNLKTRRGWDVVRSLQQLLPKIHCVPEACLCMQQRPHRLFKILALHTSEHCLCCGASCQTKRPVVELAYDKLHNTSPWNKIVKIL